MGNFLTSSLNGKFKTLHSKKKSIKQVFNNVHIIQEKKNNRGKLYQPFLEQLMFKLNKPPVLET